MKINHSSIESEVDQAILDIAQAASLMPRGKTISGGHFPEAKTKLMALIVDSRVETEKAFGGCKNCYGKGYSTARVGTSSRYGNEVHDTIIYGKCGRGKQLEALNKELKDV